MNEKQQIDKKREYASWLRELKQRYLHSRLQAALSANSFMLAYYWSIGRDIASKQYQNVYGSRFYKQLSSDLRRELPDVKGFSETNLKYMYYFYSLYSQRIENRPQPVDDFGMPIPLQAAENGMRVIRPHSVDDFTMQNLFSISWYNHRLIIDKCKDVDKAVFFVQKSCEHAWGRDMLLNFLNTDLYEREGKAVSNFARTLPPVESDMAQQMTKDPYNFDFLTLREHYDERELENALVDNVMRFLIELGRGFAFMGRQVRVQVGEEEFFPDLLFYNTRLHAYCVIELKTSKFKPEYLGQLGFYVTAVNHQMRTEQDAPTIGLLICKNKDNVAAQYALEGYSQPLGISEYELSHLMPADFKPSLPTIEEIERELEEG